MEEFTCQGVGEEIETEITMRRKVLPFPGPRKSVSGTPENEGRTHTRTPRKKTYSASGGSLIIVTGQIYFWTSRERIPGEGFQVKQGETGGMSG